ncbi:MAG TPA: formylmethanofuran dehydrogenase subunit A [Methanocorpusculum sp.]|nr:formylmethanofuran dehydrogenase subunit A [Methanocorpusculum sp.]
MTEYIIKNGCVVDPTQSINAQKMDICIKDGKFVDKVSSAAKIIDASGKLVMAAGVDIHSHVAGPKVDMGRLFRPEDKLFRSPMRGKNTKMEMGFSVPSTTKTGYDYARLGFSFVMEAAMPPLEAAHVHEEIRDTPIIDEGAMPVLANNWFLLEYFKNGEIENAGAYASWILNATRGFGLKCVNPGGTEAWGWGLNCITIHDKVPYFDITPAEIVTGLMATNEYLRLPHSVHVHANNLGNPGNYETTLDTLKLVEGFSPNNDFGREQVMHHTHIQFHCYGGDSFKSDSFESKSKEVMDYVNSQKKLTVDVGQVTLDETTTMTADGPFEYHLTHMNHLKWSNVDVELETAAGIVPFVYDPKTFIAGAQWAIGLEIALFAKDKDRCFVTADHPNAGPFWRYPRIYKWLLSAKARNDVIENQLKYGNKVIDRTYIGELADKELTLYELAQMTRSGVAKALGLKDMYGSLKTGHAANVAVYDIDPENLPSDPEQYEKAFGNSFAFFKDGILAVENHDIVNYSMPKKTVWVNSIVPENKQVERDIRDKFLHSYTVQLDNYAVFDEHVHNPYAIKVDITQ